MHLLVLLLGIVFAVKRAAYLLVFVILAILYLFEAKEAIVTYGTDIRQVAHYGIFFFTRALVYKFKLKKYLDTHLLTIAFVTHTVFPYNRQCGFTYLFWFCLSVYTIGICYLSSFKETIARTDSISMLFQFSSR